MGDKMEPKMIEIERKFLVSGDTGEKIVNAGGTFSGVVTLTDSYFDNENYSLTKEDFWLRRRNDQWELKMPPKHRQDESASCTQYREVTNEHDIVTELAAILFNNSPNDDDDDAANGNDQMYEAKDVQTMVTKFGLEPFAELKTSRKNYRMNDEISITIDETDFGFQVGEIEMMVQSSDADVISDAVGKIEGVAQSLGMQDFGTLSVADYLDESILAHISNCI